MLFESEHLDIVIMGAIFRYYYNNMILICSSDTSIYKLHRDNELNYNCLFLILIKDKVPCKHFSIFK